MIEKTLSNIVSLTVAIGLLEVAQLTQLNGGELLNARTLK